MRASAAERRKRGDSERRNIIKPALIVSAIVLLVLPVGLVVYRAHQGGYSLQTLVPVETYATALTMTMEGHGDTVSVRTFLPQSNARVTVRDERLVSELPSFSERLEDGNRVAEWSGPNVEGPRATRIEFTVFTDALMYDIDASTLVPERTVDRTLPHLGSTDAIQTDHPDIAQLALELAPAGTPLVEALRGIHGYCQELEAVSFRGTTDALTTLRLREASCNGKSRLFVALARNRGIPSRLVGGVILEPGVKRTSHQWVEVLVGPHWVPFCPTNNHFAGVPSSYLPLYWGDKVLFTHSKDINFDYRFSIRRSLGIRTELTEQAAQDPLNLMNLWSVFEQAGISVALLKVLLMIPLGALVLVILRNVIGIQTFGTFLPVLIAVAAREIGLGWGLVMFFLLIGLVSVVRLSIARLNLLHVPQMAILLTVTILFMLALGVAGVHLGDIKLSYVSMFPMAILAITTERVALMMEEEGPRRTLGIASMTALAITACYLVMNATTFQILFLTFPELILIVVLMDIWLGHWIGLRVLEHVRFRRVLSATGGDSSG